jgi:hypothetical protein
MAGWQWLAVTAEPCGLAGPAPALSGWWIRLPDCVVAVVAPVPEADHPPRQVIPG